MKDDEGLKKATAAAETMVASLRVPKSTKFLLFKKKASSFLFLFSLIAAIWGGIAGSPALIVLAIAAELWAAYLSLSYASDVAILAIVGMNIRLSELEDLAQKAREE